MVVALGWNERQDKLHWKRKPQLPISARRAHQGACFLDPAFHALRVSGP